MDTLDIVILIGFVIVILTVLLKFWPKNTIESIKSTMSVTDNNIIIEQKNKIKKNKIKKIKNVKNEKVHSNIIEQQFHNDYRDTINAFMIMSTSKRIFNPADLTVTTSKPTLSEISDIISSFINEVNNNIKTSVSDTYQTNTWFDTSPDKIMDSGWEKQQERLGLPKSIYNTPATRAPIRLIKIEHLEKEETEDDTRYVVYLIVQKENVSDQMNIRVNFVISKRDINLEKDFFDNGNNYYDANVKIEEVFVNCFLSKYDFGSKTTLSSYHDFDNLRDADGITDDKKILEVLMKKKQQLINEAKRPI